MVRRRRGRSRLLTTRRSLELRALARRLLPALTAPDDAVALTGSAARGNARADADLDLWVLGARTGRAIVSRAGVSVTLLAQRPTEARALDNLCFYEVEDLIVLQDPRGDFERLVRTWRANRRRLRARIIAATEAQLAWELERSSRGSPLHRAAFLRLSAWRMACLFVFLETGWRVPRLHLLDEVLPVREGRRLRRALALPPAERCRRVVRRVPRAIRELEAMLARDGAPTRLDVPESIAAKASTNPRESAFLARRELVLEWLPAVFARYGVTDLKGVELLEHAPTARALLLALEPRATAASVTALSREVRALGRGLGLASRRAVSWFF